MNDEIPNLIYKKDYVRQHLKFLLPDIKVANQASEALLLARIDNKNICFLAKPGTNLGSLQAASTLESTDMVNVGQRALLLGAAFGLIIGLYAYYFQSWVTESMHVNWIVLVGALMILGALLSAIAGTLFGTNFFNNGLKKYKTQINEGAILMIVSAPFQRADEICKVMSKLHLKF